MTRGNAIDKKEVYYLWKTVYTTNEVNHVKESINHHQGDCS